MKSKFLKIILGSGAFLFIFYALFIAPSHFKLLHYRFKIFQKQEPLWMKALITASSTYDAIIISYNSFLISLDHQSPLEKSELSTINLRLDLNSFQQMASNLPESAKAEYYQGEIFDHNSNQWKSIKYRFRGRNIWHWHPEKPSLRLKINDQHINLINPEDRPMIANLFAEELAQELGILTHQSQLIRLFINDQYYGIYQQTTREDEEMLALSDRQPGSLFIGDYLSPQWSTEQFEIIGDSAPIEELIRIINLDFGIEQQEQLWQIMDFEQYARWQALMNLVGGIHTDYHHNHLYYFNPKTNLLEPGTSDAMGHGALTYPRPLQRLSQKFQPDFQIPLNERLQPLLNIALRDPRFYHRRNQILYQAIQDFGSASSQQEYLFELFETINDDVYADHQKASLVETFVGWFRVPYSNQQYEESKKQLFDWIEKRNNFLLDQLNQVQVEVKISETNFVVEVTGHAAVNFNFKDEIQLLYPGLKEDYQFSYPATAGRRSSDYYLMPDKQAYSFFLDGFDKNELADQLTSAFKHSLTGKSITPTIIYDLK